MRALAIDTSTDTAGVALCDGQTCVARTPIAVTPVAADPAFPLAPAHAERLFGLIDGVLRLADWKRSDLQLVVCCVGPGSFTGIRVGVATAKGIALGLGLPIVGVGSLEVMAHAHVASLRAVDPDHAVVPLLDARKSELFWAAYAHDGALLAGPGHLAAARLGDLTRLVPRPKITFLGEVTRRLALDPASLALSAETDRPDPAFVARLGLAQFARAGSDDLDALEPAYVRPPDITLPAASS